LGDAAREQELRRRVISQQDDGQIVGVLVGFAAVLVGILTLVGFISVVAYYRLAAITSAVIVGMVVGLLPSMWWHRHTTAKLKPLIVDLPHLDPVEPIPREQKILHRIVLLGLGLLAGATMWPALRLGAPPPQPPPGQPMVFYWRSVPFVVTAVFFWVSLVLIVRQRRLKRRGSGNSFAAILVSGLAALVFAAVGCQNYVHPKPKIVISDRYLGCGTFLLNGRNKRHSYVTWQQICCDRPRPDARAHDRREQLCSSASECAL